VVAAVTGSGADGVPGSGAVERLAVGVGVADAAAAGVGRGPRIAGSIAQVTLAPSVPWISRSSREPGPIAFFQAAVRAGLSVTVLDRGPIAGGTSGAGEGNLLVSDKPVGPELALALHSLRHWRHLAARLGERTGLPGGGFEYEPKGGLIVALAPESLNAVAELVAGQRTAGVEVREVDATELPDVEPHLAEGLAGGAYYPQDAQLQPMLATARLLQEARALGARVVTHTAVTGIELGAGRVTGVRTSTGERLATGAVVNATGTWGGHLAALAGVRVPVLPRRGVILVTQPLPPIVRHKVYAAEYLSDVASGEAGLESSAVVESTPGGTVLIGASRERVGFDPAMPVPVLRRLARQALQLFPGLSGARLLRTYRGYRPYCPDHLPVIGPDARVPGLLHACGHEGAGIGLAPGTGLLLAQVLTGRTPDLDLAPFRPERFEEAA
jgi:glycine/D-amino acid oxidase-like deaminating enzyme